MQKLFDKILADKIKSIFNNHKEDYNPDDWKKLKAKLKTGKKHTPVIWINIAKAASVVLFVGFSTFYANRNDLNIKSSHIINNEIDTNFNINKNIIKEKVLITQINKETAKNNIQKSNTDSVYEKNNVTNKLITDSIKKNNNLEIQLANNNDSLSSKEIVANIDSSKNKSQKQIVKIQQPKEEFEIINKENDSKFNFAVEVASMYSNSNKSNEGNVNVGGGFTTSYKFSDKFSISTGMLVAQQSLDYSNSQNLMFGSYDFASNEGVNTLINNPESSESTIDFVGIDIPLNIQFETEKFIFTTGVSSLVFINEKRTYSTNTLVINTAFDLTTGNYVTKNINRTIKTEDKSPSFNRIDFAKLLNISVGYKVPLKKGSFIIEPFIKYPLGTISSANLKIGSGGLSLHYIF